MAERSRRGVRRQISDTPDEVSEQSASESEQDWDPRKSDSSRRAGKPEHQKMKKANRGRKLNVSPNTARSRRAATDDSNKSIKLTMKVAPSKLREVMRANELDSLHDTLGGGQVIDGPRSRRSAANPRASGRGANRPSYAEFGESDIEDEEEAEDDEMNDFDEVGAEAEGGTDGDDVEMEDAPSITLKSQTQTKQQPKITLKPPPTVTTKPGPRAKPVMKPPLNNLPFKSVEEQEMEDAEAEEVEEEEDEEEDEEGTSELSDDEDATNLNEEDMDGEEVMEEEDAEGEDEEIEDEEDEEDDSEGDSDDENSASNMGTPDPTKLTKRQRGRPEDQTTLLALDMAPQQRKFFTDEEKAMKKDEHARKRKELTKRKINEEKTAALNRLLKPQVSKARGAAPKPETLAAATAAIAATDMELTDPIDPLYIRWVSNKAGSKLGVPEEWLGKHVGKNFGPPLSSTTMNTTAATTGGGGVLVQEVE